MLKTRITELLGIKYPILMGGMQWITTAEMVAAFAEAGGMGFIPCASFESLDDLKDEIRKTKDLTDKPFGLNISMLPDTNLSGITMGYVEIGIDANVNAFETSGRSPDELVPVAREAGIPIIHKVSHSRFAKKAERVGVDAVAVAGFECGGHPGMAEITTMVLTPKVAGALSVPVIAGGGIVDGRSLVAALALGAEGVIMGTRFMASRESPIHKNFKDWILNATENDTVLVMRSINNPVRVIHNETARKTLEIEKRGTTLEELLTYAAGKYGKQAYETGDVDLGVISMGECVGLIDEIKSIGQIVDDIVNDAESVMNRLNAVIS